MMKQSEKSPVLERMFALLGLLLFFCCTPTLASYDFNLGRRQCLLSYAAYCGNNVNVLSIHLLTFDQIGQGWNCYWCKQVGGVEWIGNFGNSSSM